MTDTTKEEAYRCFMCGEPGRLKKTTRAGHGTRVETVECVNERCENWDDVLKEGAFWLVQINADGSIPPKGEGLNQPKQFDITRHTTEQERQRARDILRGYEEQGVRGGRQ